MAAMRRHLLELGCLCSKACGEEIPQLAMSHGKNTSLMKMI